MIAVLVMILMLYLVYRIVKENDKPKIKHYGD